MNKNKITSKLSLISSAVKQNCNSTDANEQTYIQVLNDNLVTIRVSLNGKCILAIVDEPSSLDKLVFQHKIDQGISLSGMEVFALLVSKGKLETDNKGLYREVLIAEILQRSCSIARTNENCLLLKECVADYLKIYLPNNQFIAGKSCSFNEEIMDEDGSVATISFEIEYFGSQQQIDKLFVDKAYQPEIHNAKPVVGITTQENSNNVINDNANQRFSILLKIENEQVFYIELCGSVSDYYNPATGRHFMSEAKAIYNCFNKKSKTSNNIYNLLSLVFNYCQSWGADLPNVIKNKGRFKRDRTVGQSKEKLLLEVIDLS